MHGLVVPAHLNLRCCSSFSSRFGVQRPTSNLWNRTGYFRHGIEPSLRSSPRADQGFGEFHPAWILGQRLSFLLVQCLGTPWPSQSLVAEGCHSAGHGLIGPVHRPFGRPVFVEPCRLRVVLGTLNSGQTAMASNCKIPVRIPHPGTANQRGRIDAGSCMDSWRLLALGQE